MHRPCTLSLVILAGCAGSAPGSAQVDDQEPGEHGVPSISGEPEDANVDEGQTAAFAVTATGDLPLSYQWMKNGAAIDGATASSYSLVATAADNGTTFSVSVSNNGGSATSRAATLTVNPMGGGYILTVSATNGTVVKSPDKATYGAGEKVDLITRPNTGYSFEEWSGDASGRRVMTRIVMNRSKSVVAAFGTWHPPTGIPAPDFGVTETYRMYDDEAKRNPQLTYSQNEEGGYYTHYIDGANETSTDRDNPYGTAAKPRKSLPGESDVPPGSVIEFHGGPYTYGYRIYRVVGTSEMPIFIRGFDAVHRVELNGVLYLRSAYLIFENFRRTSGGLAIRSSPDSKGHHVSIRNGEFVGAGPGFLADSGEVGEQLVFYNNDVDAHAFDPQDGPFEEADGGGIGLTSYTDGVWIVDNHITRAGGDATGGGHAAKYTARNYYIGRNVMHTCGENAIDIKEVDTAIVSENVMYDFRGWSSGSDGTAVVIHYGPTYSPKNVWIVNNDIFDCSDKGIQVGGSQEYDVHIVGNTVHDITNSEGSACGYVTWDSRNVYLTNNTFYNVDNGVRSWVDGTGAEGLFARNNIFSTVRAGTGRHLIIGGSTHQGKSSFESNLFYQPGGEASVQWGNTTYALAQFIQATDKCQDCREGDPLFTNPATGDFALSTGSPAQDAGMEADDYALFESTQGEDIRVDPNGTVRPANGGWDIGAFEVPGA